MRAAVENEGSANPEPHTPSYVAVPIEDPSGAALKHFHAALRSAEAKRGQARILIYGASHTAADIYPDILRRRLQARFGDAGAGFVMPAKPLRHYSLPGISFRRSVGWSGFHVRTSTIGEDHYGLAGMYLLPSRKHARAVFVTKPHAGLSGFASDFELYYWKQPGGGHFKLAIDGKAHDLSTSGKAGAAYHHWSVPDGNHRVELAVRGDGPVRIFGLSIERDQPGVIVDTLGIPGARASTQLLWDEDLHREHLRRRHPDLVILAYGTNEAGDDDKPIERYAANLRKVLARIREAVPKASCVLIGPSDRPIHADDGTYIDRPRTAQVVATQREVSSEFGCGFFDLVSFMGGPLSMLDWCDGQPPYGANDHIHFTHRGYQALGNVLHDSLLAGFKDHAIPALIGADVFSDAEQPVPRAAQDAGREAGPKPKAPSVRHNDPPSRARQVSVSPRGSRRNPSTTRGSTYRR